MKEKTRLLISIILVFISSFVQACIIQSMIKPSNLMPMGFTGLAFLLNMLFETVGIKISISFFMILLNLPVAILCAKHISTKFTLLSLLQIVMTASFLKILHIKPFFNNIFLDIIIGGVIYGLALVLALRAGGSTGGTDFIALYISNRINKTIWEYMFAFNAIMIVILGYKFSWSIAGYSLIYQYIVTKTIEAFYNRYNRMTLQIITKKPDEIIQKFTENIRHGITKTKGYGGYSKQEICILYTVISSYELSDAVRLIKSVDEDVLINILKTEEFHGKFYIKPM